MPKLSISSRESLFQPSNFLNGKRNRDPSSWRLSTRRNKRESWNAQQPTDQSPLLKKLNSTNVYFQKIWNMNQHLQLEHKLLWLFGKSGSGKTSFFKAVLLPRWSNGDIYILTKDSTEWSSTPNITILSKDFNIQNISTLPENSLIFFDDFSKACSDKQFQEIVNFNLRHEKKP